MGLSTRWLDRLTAQWGRPVPSAASRLLQPLAWIHGLLVAIRRGLFAAGVLHSAQAPRPVIVVGNVVVGGAGKTPASIALVLWLRTQGHIPGVISRGHGRSSRTTQLVTGASEPAEVGDEPLLIHLRTGAPVAVGRDRLAAAALLCEAHPETDIIVSDDGLQHLRMRRSIGVILFDDRGIGNGLLLPAGPLRESLPEKVPDRHLVLYTGGTRSTVLPGYRGRRALAGVVPLREWWANPQARPQPLAHLAGQPLVAAAGLARPGAFFDMLDAAGLHVRRLPLPDHDDLTTLPWHGHTGAVIVTEKDAVKLRADRPECGQVWVARLDFEPEPAFLAALIALLPRPAPRPPTEPAPP